METKKNKLIKWIVIALAVILIAPIAVWGRQYYNDRYVGTDYYTMIPLDYDVTPETIYSTNGEVVGPGVKYKLTAYNEQGESRIVEFTIRKDRVKIQPPGTYLLVSASKQIVVNWSVTEESKIPGKVLKKIEGNK
jgi:uncharacterized protein (TIGR01655 family)